MKNNKITVGLGILTLVAGLGIGSITLASSKNPDNQNYKQKNVNAKMLNLSAEQKAAMENLRTQNQANYTAVKAALEANNYNAWVIAVGANSPILQKINATNFPRLVEAYKLKTQASAIQNQAHAIMTELGLDKGDEIGKGRGMGLMMGKGIGLHKGLNK